MKLIQNLALIWIACLSLITSLSHAGPPFPEFVDPNPNTGNQFGYSVVPLSTGNVVIVSCLDDAAGFNAGAVYLFNGATGALISTLRGASDNDIIGSGGVREVGNGNFVVLSPAWKNGTRTNAGAVTWGSGISGVSGVVSSSNSLVGISSNDQVGGIGVTVLSNGNYVVRSPYWSGGGKSMAGAVTWGDGGSGVKGTVNSSNSLVGTTVGDQVGDGILVELTNGNYVVLSHSWDNGPAIDAGAVTWGSGSSGVIGAVSSSNSLVGSKVSDQVGSLGVKALSNGNYVVVSPNWDNGAAFDAGAVTWGSGSGGVKGMVSSGNSLVGGQAGDQVGSGGVKALSNNGNYVISSPNWDNEATVDAGAVTWCSGSSEVSGVVSSSNSLVGSQANDQVGSLSVLALSNGDYVVLSPNWNNGTAVNAGAATWCSGSSEVSGAVGSHNSLVGSQASDQVGNRGAIELSNGNYVVRSSNWDNGAATDAGAVTWCSGGSEVSGVVSSSNSLVGSQANDQVGYESVIMLSNGNFVVLSPFWNNGAAVNAGAVTWCSSSGEMSGVVSSTNSLVGSKAYDRVGDRVTGSYVRALSNGNYVVCSPFWDNGSLVDVGAVTWGSGSNGVSGPVSSSNSLVGSKANDQVGYRGVTALGNDNYVVCSPSWDNGSLVDVGAVTWGNGSSGLSGPVSSSNSLVGSKANDQVGYGGVTALGNDNYVVCSPYWDSVTKSNAGAVTWGPGSSGVSGAVSSNNSLVGLTLGTSLIDIVVDDVNSTYIGRFLSEGSGKVRLGSIVDGLALNPPIITGITPSSGTTAGDTVVTINGAYFVGTIEVSFDGTKATAVTVNNAAQITATTPSHAAGAVSVLVTTIGGTNEPNSLYTYIVPAPTVTRNTVNMTRKITNLTITGTDFDAVTPSNNIVTFTPAGTGTVTAATATSLTVTGLSGQTLGALYAVVNTNGKSSGTAVQVATVINAAPTALTLTGNTLSENSAANSTVGTFSTTDVDADDTFTYTLVGGTGSTDNASFNISGSSLRITASPNYESKSSYSVRVRTTDAGGLSVENKFSITITDVNEAPTALALSNNTLAENSAANSTLGTLSSTDPDSGDTSTYTLVSGTGSTDNAAFNILGSELRLTATPNYEVKSSYSVRVRTTDAGSLTFENSFTITITNVNEAPTALALSSNTLPENSGTNSTVGTLSATDVDSDDTFTYTLVSGAGSTDNASFNISGSSLRITASPNYEAKSSYSVRVRTTDAGSLTFENSFTLTITDVNEAPTAIALSNNTLAENNVANTTVGTLSATDPDADPTHTFSLVAGSGDTDNDSFSIIGTDLKISVIADYETKSSYSIRVRADDGEGGVFEQVLTLTILDVAEPVVTIMGKDQLITNGDTTPDAADATDFGSLALLNSPVTHVFTIGNGGDATLSLDDPAVVISGPGADDFKVTTLPAAEVVADSQTTFAITFDPLLPGLRTATVTVASDDLVNGSYSFVIIGFGELSKLLAQTITFAPPTTVYLDQGPLNLSASASSGLPVTLSVVPAGTTAEGASLNGNGLSFTSLGKVKVQAVQAGDGTYAAAKTVVKTITVKATPTGLTLVDLAQTYTGTPRAIGTLGGSGEVTIEYKIGTTLGSTPPTSAGKYSVKATDSNGSKTGTLLIAKARLYVTPDNQRKFAGQENPELTSVYSGFMESDTEAVFTKVPALKTTAKATSAGGLYPITASGGAAANYLFVYQQGTLVVESFGGSYEALLVDADDLPVGKLTLTVPLTGQSFSGKLTTATETTALSLKGTLTTDVGDELATGTATVMKGSVSYDLSFTLPMQGDMLVTVTRDSQPLGGTTTGRKLLALAKASAVLYSGAHTAVLEPALPAAGDIPAGAGWATATLSKTGVMTLAGRLADGTDFTTALAPDADPDPGYRLFVQPYKKRTESYLGGVFTLLPHPTLTNRRYVSEASLHWKKAGFEADVTYRTGFGPVTTVMMLDPWLPPVAAKGSTSTITLSTRLGLTDSTFGVKLSDTGSTLNGNLPTRVGLSLKNEVSVQLPLTSSENVTRWKTKLVPKTGLFSGSFELADTGAKPRVVTFSGVLRQPASTPDVLIGDGHYLLPPLVGTERTTGEVMFTRP